MQHMCALAARQGKVKSTNPPKHGQLHELSSELPCELDNPKLLQSGEIRETAQRYDKHHYKRHVAISGGHIQVQLLKISTSLQ